MELPIQLIPGTIHLGVKEAGHEADHSLPSRAKVRSELNCTCTPPDAFTARMQTLPLFIEHKIYELDSRQCSCVCIMYTWHRRAPDISFQKKSNSPSHIQYRNINLKVNGKLM